MCIRNFSVHVCVCKFSKHNIVQSVYMEAKKIWIFLCFVLPQTKKLLRQFFFVGRWACAGGENEAKKILFFLHCNLAIAHNLFNHMLRKWKHFDSLQLGGIKYFAPISVFWILVRISRLIHLTRARWCFVCKSFSDFFLPHLMEAKKLCFTWI